MKKISSLFKRDLGTNLVFDEIVPGAEWVIAGEGIATQKYDGTCCMIRGGKLFKRYDAKRGKKPPPGFEPAQEPDPKTGHWPGWLAVNDSSDDKWHREAFALQSDLIDGSYELCGPKIQGNPEKLEKHTLIAHGYTKLKDVPRTFNALKEWFKGKDIEGIVWHHPFGCMVKIKAKDFGIKRGAK